MIGDTRFVQIGDRISNDDAAIIGPELMRIARRHENALTPHLVVVEAEPKGAPLHRFFEWDDKAAAKHHRIHQAQLLVSSVAIEIVDANGAVSQVRGFVSASTQETMDIGGFGGDAVKPRRVYMPISVARRDERVWADVLDEAQRRLFAWQQRYQSLLDYDDGKALLAGVMQEIAALKERAA